MYKVAETRVAPLNKARLFYQLSLLTVANFSGADCYIRMLFLQWNKCSIDIASNLFFIIFLLVAPQYFSPNCYGIVLHNREDKPA